MRVVVDGHVAAAHHLEAVAAHHDRGVLVEADAEQVGMALDDGHEVELAVALEQVLVDGDALEEPQPHHVIADHQGVAPGIAADHERALDGGAGGGAPDDPAAGEHRPQLLVRPRVQVGVGQPPLAPAREPDAARLAQGSDEGLGVRRLAVARVDDLQVARPRVGEVAKVLGIVGQLVALARRRDHHDARIGAAREVQEALEDGLALEAAAHDDECAAGGTEVGPSRRGRRRGRGRRRRRLGESPPGERGRAGRGRDQGQAARDEPRPHRAGLPSRAATAPSDSSTRSMRSSPAFRSWGSLPSPMRR